MTEILLINLIRMKTVEYLPHIADIRMKIQGSTQEELFRAGMEGIGRILKTSVFESVAKADQIQQFSLESVDITALLVEFLNEVLMYSHTQKAVFFKLEIGYIDEHKLTAKIFGVRVEDFDDDIKAVTYHEADVIINESGIFETIIVLDI